MITMNKFEIGDVVAKIEYEYDSSTSETISKLYPFFIGKIIEKEYVDEDSIYWIEELDVNPHWLYTAEVKYLRDTEVEEGLRVVFMEETVCSFEEHLRKGDFTVLEYIDYKNKNLC
jgi:hypothetical protein